MRTVAPPEIILAAFRYEPVTGVFTRLHGRHAGRADLPAPDGYRRVKFLDRHYSAHRLAWLFTFGEWPVICVDHIDGDRGNNAIRNLRLATNAENQRNRRNAGRFLKGVTLSRSTGKFQAQIKVEGRVRYLGVFLTEELAHAAYLDAARKHFGEFARSA